MKFAIYGAGAVGGFLGARLLEAGHEVHFVARGDTLEALSKTGLVVHSSVFGSRTYSVQAASDPEAIGPSDYVVLAVKANALRQIAPLVEPLKGPRTTFVSTQNGLPWWYAHGALGEDEPIKAVDPDGIIARHMPAAQVVGSIVYFSCSLTGAGEVEHTTGARLPLGEPDGGRTERVLALSKALRAGGIKAPVREDIRHELWVKLMGNAAFNPLSALTGMTLSELIDYPHSRSLIESMMEEVRQVAAAVGVRIAISVEKRIEGTKAAGSHKTSMLQDYDLAREPEIEALLGSVLELAARHSVRTPALSAVTAGTRALFKRLLDQRLRPPWEQD